jgi:EpsI family protein
MIRRLITLQSALLLGLGSVFLLPKKIEIQPAAIQLALPDFVGEWYGSEQPILQGERDALGPDTQFARKLYTNGKGDQIFVSIVFSGPDMSTSIHRPERCLPAQGWTVAETSPKKIPLANGSLDATRLRNVRHLQDKKHSFSIYSLDYYWFVGHDAETGSHLRRTWIDIRDRVFKGENQQWAFVTAISTITKGIQPFGRSEAETDALLSNFIRDLVPQLKRDNLSASK